jgi:hypothetical protein
MLLKRWRAAGFKLLFSKFCSARFAGAAHRIAATGTDGSN